MQLKKLILALQTQLIPYLFPDAIISYSPSHFLKCYRRPAKPQILIYSSLQFQADIKNINQNKNCT